MYESQLKKFLLDRYSFLLTREIYVFGAGYMGQLTVESLLRLDLNIKKIIDNDSSKYNSTIEGISIGPLDSFFESKSKNVFIIIAIEKYEQVIDQLKNAGISKFVYESIYKEISEAMKLDPILRELSRAFSDINLQMKKDALVETANFVKENMFEVTQYDNRFEMIKEILSKPKIDGLYMEFGVYKGDSINYISSLVPSEIVYGFDSFEGLPEFWVPEYGKGSFHAQGIPDVRANVQLVKGWFNETLPVFLTNQDRNCSFIHIDCDLYSSAKTIFNELKSRIIEGTIILFDEFFNYANWKNGEYRAFIEFIEETELNFEYLGYVPEGLQVGVKIIK